MAIRGGGCLNARRWWSFTPVFNEEEAGPAYVGHVTRVLLDDRDTDFRVILVDDGRHGPELGADHESLRTAVPWGPALPQLGSHMALSAGFGHVDADVGRRDAGVRPAGPAGRRSSSSSRSGSRALDIVWGQRRARDGLGLEGGHEQAVQPGPDRARHAPGEQVHHRQLPARRPHRVLDCFNQFKEHNRITFALVAWTGFDQVRVPYHRAPARRARPAGASRKMPQVDVRRVHRALHAADPRDEVGRRPSRCSSPVILIVYTVAAGDADADADPRLGQPDDRRGRVLRRPVHADGDRGGVPQPHLHRVDAPTVLLRQWRYGPSTGGAASAGAPARCAFSNHHVTAPAARVSPVRAT